MLGSAASWFLVITITVVVVAGVITFVVGSDIDRNRPFRDDRDRRA